MEFDTGLIADGENIILEINAGDYIPDDLEALAKSVFLSASQMSQLMVGYSTEYVCLVIMTYLAAYKKATGDNPARIIADVLEAAEEFPLKPMEEYPEC